MDERDPPGLERPGDLDETTLVARAQDGDLAAFEYLVEAYQGRLFRLAVRMLDDRCDAEDVVQETLIACWRKLPLLVDARTFGGWLYRVATNRCLDMLRRRSRQPVTGQEAADREPFPASGAGTDPAYEAEVSLEVDGLVAALAELPPGLRACWLLREIHDRSYAEIAATLEITEQAVRGRLARARAQLAGRMESWH